MSMICHFIDQINYNLYSYVLGCRIVIATHNYSKIEVISWGYNWNKSDLQYRYNLKITHIVTDNASYFEKCFRTFSNPKISLDNSETYNFGNFNTNDSDDSEFYDDDNIERMDVCTIFIIISNNNNDLEIQTNDNFNLPQYIDCVVHSLNLVTITDISKILDTTFNNIHKTTFINYKHFRTYWVNTMTSNIVVKMCYCKFPIPVYTK